MQLDVFIPALSLAFEYQGIQHFDNSFFWGRSVHMYKDRDQEKRDACSTGGITLIEVPYWWDNTKETLAASIHLKRPGISTIRSIVTCLELNLESVASQPIPLKEPSKISYTSHRSLSTEMEWPTNQDPSGWWMTEKHSGIRLLWDGHSLVSKNIEKCAAPKEFIQGLPNGIRLDVELR
jgi:hypothetical protein